MRSEVEQALAEPAERIGQALLRIPESQWFDRKSHRIAARDLANAEIAFANAEGGTIVVGLKDDVVEGISARAKAINDLRQAAIDHSEPLVRVHCQEVDCVNSSGDADRLLVFEVEPSDVVHSNGKDEVFLRVGDETRKLTFVQRQELTYDKGQNIFDGTLVAGFSSRDLHWDSVYDWAEGLDSLDPERLLQRRGLVRDDSVTAAAVLLFGMDPQVVYPNAYVRVLRYRGIARGTGGRQQLVTDRTFEGRIDEILSQASAAVRHLQPTVRRLSSDTGRFTDIPLIPEEGWLEALVNAVVHRSYSLEGDHIRVEIFDDRIEVTNPGRFPGLAEASDPRDAMRFARNPRIARVCTEQGWAQELGEGIRRMFDVMSMYGLPEPSYFQSAGAVRVTLASSSIDPSVASQMPSGWHDVVAALGQAGQLRTGELTELLGVTRPTAIRRLRAMEALGVIAWVGESAQDPHAYWTLAARGAGN